MPCKTCNCTLIYYYDEPFCPKCRRLAILDSDSAIRATERVHNSIKNSFDNELSKWHRDYLVANLAARRELIARKFFREYNSTPVGEMANLTLIISRCFELCGQRGKTTEDVNEIANLIDRFKQLNEFENTVLRIKSCYNNVLCLNTYHNDNLNINQLVANIKVVSNEHYENLKNTLALHDIYTEKEAGEKIEQFKKEVNEAEERSKKIEYFLLSPNEFIKKYFLLLNSMHVLFVQDYNHMYIFERLKKFRNFMTDPRALIRFIVRFKREGDNITITNKEVFLWYAMTFFDASAEEIETNLLCGHSNTLSFPLFNEVNIEDLGGDIVIISPDFSRFIYTILHAYITEIAYNQETMKRSLHFEQRIVKDKFESIGYTYHSNIKVKNKFEIDGVAIKKNRCYVVECKGPRLPTLIYEKRKRDEIIRDLAGIVKGEKYSHIGGQIRVEHRPSIKEKRDFIEKNFNTLFDNTNPLVEGLVVIPDYPPIHSIENIKILSIHRLQDELK